MDTRHAKAFIGNEGGVRRARQWLVGNLDGHPHAEDIELAGSELITNALKHTASGGWLFCVSLEREDDGTRVTVHDFGGASEPTRREPTEDEVGGHGLALVSEVSDAWGTAGDRNGRDVWAYWDDDLAGCRTLGF